MKVSRGGVGSPDDAGSAGSRPCGLQAVEEEAERDRIAPSETNIKVQGSVFIQAHQ